MGCFIGFIFPFKALVPRLTAPSLSQEPPRPCLALLWDLLELADLLGAPRLHLVLDHRQHQTQSLLHAGLAQYQGAGGLRVAPKLRGQSPVPLRPSRAGPALCVVMPGVTVGPEELSDLMATRASAVGSPLMVRGRAAACNTLGLLGCFAVTEVRPYSDWQVCVT